MWYIDCCKKVLFKVSLPIFIHLSRPPVFDCLQHTGCVYCIYRRPSYTFHRLETAATECALSDGTFSSDAQADDCEAMHEIVVTMTLVANVERALNMKVQIENCNWMHIMT